MKYLELNKKLAELLGYTVVEREAGRSLVWVMFKDENIYSLVDYCNSWEDTGKLIDKYLITVEPEVNQCCDICNEYYNTRSWEASYGNVNKEFFGCYIGETPLHAVVELLVNEFGKGG